MIDGATNTTTSVAAGSGPISVAVNPVTNKIYVANANSGNVTVIDGATNTTTTVAAGSGAESVAVNPVTNKIYIANGSSGNVTVITEQQVQPIPLTASINPLPGNQTSSSTPGFTFSASSTFSPIATAPDTVYYQVDTWQGPWNAATGTNPTYAGMLAPLQPGFHILYAFAGDSEEATSATAGGRLIGFIQAYGFLYGLLAGPQLITPTVTFTGAPASAAYNSTFTVSATTNASSTAVITAGAACSIAGNTVTMTSGTGTCSVTANWAADSTYSSARASHFVAASKITPMVTFTGAPASAAYNSTFTVSATTNASTMAVITAGAACSIAGNTVTMTSGTGACSLTANWAADSDYSSATASQSTTAAAPTIPVITNVAAIGITSTSATLSWSTDQPSSSQVEYGTTIGYGSFSVLNSAPVTLHSVTLTGLSPGTTYDYAVMSADSAGPAASANFIFSTPAIVLASTISRVGGAHSNTGSSSAPTALSIPYTSGNNNTVVVVCALGSTSSSISSLTDNGSAWTLRAYASNGTAVRSEIWSTGAGRSVASTSFNINLSGGTPMSCALEEYSGVHSIGATAASQATSGTMSVSLTTQDTNNYVVAGLGMNSFYGYFVTNGTAQQAAGMTANPGNDYVEMDLCDNTSRYGNFRHVFLRLRPRRLGGSCTGAPFGNWSSISSGDHQCYGHRRYQYFGHPYLDHGPALQFSGRVWNDGWLRFFFDPQLRTGDVAFGDLDRTQSEHGLRLRSHFRGLGRSCHVGELHLLDPLGLSRGRVWDFCSRRRA